MNRIVMEVNISGQDFTLIYDIPDACGKITVPDQNVKWLDEHIQRALVPVLGKLHPVTTIKVPKVLSVPARHAAQIV